MQFELLSTPGWKNDSSIAMTIIFPTFRWFEVGTREGLKCQ